VFEVHAVSVNTVGFSKEGNRLSIHKKALELGATSYTSLDAVQNIFMKRVVKF